MGKFEKRMDGYERICSGIKGLPKNISGGRGS